MNCNVEIGTDRNALRRIMAVLFALADLADRAAGRPWPVRCLVLSILGHAEEIAHAFVGGSAIPANSDPSPPASPVLPLRGDGPIDAMRLAQSFRMLALALRAMLASRFHGRLGTDADHVAAGDRAGGSWPLPARLSRQRQAAAVPGPGFLRAASNQWLDTS